MFGNGILEIWLGEIREAVEREGELTAGTIEKLLEHFGGKPNSLTRKLEEFRGKMQANPDALEAGALRERTANAL